MITMTAKAAEHIAQIIENRGSGVAFRIGIKQTGCSGYMYVPEIVDEINDHDIQVRTEAGILVVFDPKWQAILAGTELDYVQKALGLEQLIFNNPNVDSLCGCGESFNLRENDDE